MAKGRLALYNVEDVILDLGGIVIEDQLPEGAFWKMSPPELFSHMRGIGRSMARYLVGDAGCACELTLLNTSEHNQQLAALVVSDFQIGGGAGIFPAILKDNSGATLKVTDKCWVTKMPEWEVGEAVREVTWNLMWKYDPSLNIPGGN